LQEEKQQQEKTKAEAEVPYPYVWIDLKQCYMMPQFYIFVT